MSANKQRGRRRRRVVQSARSTRTTRGPSAQRDRREDVVAADPDLRNYLRAPYDPLYQAQATRFFGRGLLHAASSGGRMRIGVLILALGAVAGMIVGLGIALDAVIARQGQWGAAVIWSLSFTVVAGLFGMTLLQRLLHHSSR
jgi:hypothetical protein